MDAADWDARYAASDLVWSPRPNVWVEEFLASMPPGRALDLAAGEGRHAIWLAQRGWSVTAVDFSAVAIDRLRVLVDEHLGAGASAVTARVGDARAAAEGDQAAYDLVLIAYLHLPPADWRLALEAATAASAPGGVVFVVAHALRNLTEGVGGPGDVSVLLDPGMAVESARGLPLSVEIAELRERAVEGADRAALDTVVVFRRRP